MTLPLIVLLLNLLLVMGWLLAAYREWRAR
jgi:hypothetical protein